MTLDKFIFPKGIRFATVHELPAGWTLQTNDDSIRAGFTMSRAHDAPHLYSAEINVSAPQIWEVLESLTVSLLSNDVTLVLGLDDEESFRAQHIPRNTVLSILRSYRQSICHDCFLQVAILDAHEEDVGLILDKTKYFTVRSSNLSALRAVMDVHGIVEQEALTFIDEFPHVTVADYDGATMTYAEVFAGIKRQCNKWLEP